ncbi:hypothetical protein [Cryobacterium luteum]|uniref:Leucine rich repeat variant domain-containing protein n=1 Tax=Cryobacterium luteum TaxID=1424661 RepID=A0A1H8C2Z5_9MICO|nr:hypothetical protein [Cryobacterium luteum]TFB89199.1 hypothetical protein E3O10_09965 [Cryobacterium luteum]SEM88447.1 hypothetical protein SAMN05216281_102185 [Cryobacterium luteum]
MTDSTSPLFREAADPATPQARLAEIAAAHHDLHLVISANPSCYPALIEWMLQLGTIAPVAPATPVIPEPVLTEDAAAEQAAAVPAAAAPTGLPTEPAASAVPNPFAPSASAAAPRSTPAPGQDARGQSARRPRKKLLIWSSIGVVVLLIAGGGVWAYGAIFSKLGGASSPTAAVQKLLEGTADMDLVSLYGSLSPAEIESFKAPIDQLGTMAMDDENGDPVDLPALINTVVDSLNITLTGLQLESEDIEDGVAVVTITAGEMTMNGDAETITDAYLEVVAPQLRLQQQSFGYDDSDTDAMIADLRESSIDELNDMLPFTQSAADLAEELGHDAAVVTVREGGSWYVSPLLTAGENLLLGASQTRGSLVAADDVAAFDTGDAAAEGFAEAVIAFGENGDYGDLAAVVPESERRFLSLYGDALMPTDGGGDYDNLTITDFAVTPQVEGKTARLDIDSIVIEGDGYDWPYRTEFSGVCVTTDSGYSSFDGCLDDVPAMKELGAGSWRVLAVQEQGGWFVSPLRTIADVTGIAVEKLVKLSQDGELDRLYQ